MEQSNRPEEPVIIRVPRERMHGEARVALVPDMVRQLVGEGFAVIVEAGAGNSAYFPDALYAEAGARVESDPTAVYGAHGILVKVQPPRPEEIALMSPGSLLISFLDRAVDAGMREALERKRITAFSFNAVPRITRAQSMDALSSMSTVAGYKAVLLAADRIGRFFPMLMTAAGTVPPAHVFVIGAGVAGLQALATARRLGAVTAGCDARPEVREQVQSVGAAFVDMNVSAQSVGTGYAPELGDDVHARERDAIRGRVAAANVVICTAQVPGARAPLLIDEAMVQAMQPGSVIVDLAAETGGNCALTSPDEMVSRSGVTILGPTNIAAAMPTHASQLYSRNLAAVIRHVVKEGAIVLDPTDEIIHASCLTNVPTPA